MLVNGRDLITTIRSPNSLLSENLQKKLKTYKQRNYVQLKLITGNDNTLLKQNMKIYGLEALSKGIILQTQHAFTKFL